MRVSPRYEPIHAHLSGDAGSEKTMSFKDVENLLGRELPPTARGEFARQWWANTTSHSQATAWLGAGWRVQRLDPAGEVVQFRRLNGNAAADPLERADTLQEESARDNRSDVILHRQRLSSSAVRMLEDWAEERGVDLSEAATELLNQAASDRRKRLLDWFAANTVHSPVSTAELIREDRDAR